MSADLRFLREFGEGLDPPTGQPSEDLRDRVLAGTAANRSTERRRAWSGAVGRVWPLTVAAAAVLAVLAVTAQAHWPGAGPTTRETRTATQVLQLAADHLAAAPTLAARPDQFVFSESAVDVGRLRWQGHWVLVRLPPMAVRQWRPVGGAGDGLTHERPADRPDAPWRSTPIPGCADGDNGAHTCTAGPDVSGLPTDGNLMYEFLYRTTYLDVPAAYAALIGADDLAFERAARVLSRSQTSSAVQAAVLAAIDRIPGVTVGTDPTEVTGRRGVALVRRGSIGTTEVILDATTYRYLGMKLTVEPVGWVVAADGTTVLVTTGEAVQRVAIVDHPGDLP
jgi:hypothetical protein